MGTEARQQDAAAFAQEPDKPSARLLRKLDGGRQGLRLPGKRKLEQQSLGAKEQRHGVVFDSTDERAS